MVKEGVIVRLSNENFTGMVEQDKATTIHYFKSLLHRQLESGTDPTSDFIDESRVETIPKVLVIAANSSKVSKFSIPKLIKEIHCFKHINKKYI